jgi:octaheme c-type cytochrome (tetrathionate reductase family)
MNMVRYRWVWGTALILGILILPVVYFAPAREAPHDPGAYLPAHPQHTDHTSLMTGPYEDGPAVTRACLECHAEAAGQIMATAHWKWEGDPVLVPGHDQAMAIGKKTLINNFCIGIQSNWPSCTSCHAGYGWTDESFDFSRAESIDCLVCHDRSGTYIKAAAGLPAAGVDLVAVAQSVGTATRENCGSCHFRGGGGDAVKHGDLDASLTFPRERLDVHMGEHQLLCTDCHRTKDHLISGRSIAVSVDDANQIRCADCHAAQPHRDQRLNLHTRTVACQTCHIPAVALREATKTHWDWSAAGQDREEDLASYLKIKGSFEYQKQLPPEYHWYNGTARRYLLGDTINPDEATVLNPPRGDLADPQAKIWPFKVHRGSQIYDAENLYFLQPKTAGAGGYWREFDWDQAARLGSEASGLEYSGEYAFATTEMFWPLSHMVAPTEEALQCTDCHGDGGRMDWEALGYPGDPMEWGSRAMGGGER